MSGYQNSEAAVSIPLWPDIVCWRFRDIVIVARACNRHYELDMVILKVGLLHEPLVLCTAVKFISCHPFILKFHIIYILSCTYKKNK